MDHHIAWEVVGDRGLTVSEADDVVLHVMSWREVIGDYDMFVANAPQPDVQAFYLVRHDHAAAIADVFNALGELQRQLPAFEVRVQRDFLAYRWNGNAFDQVPETGILAHPIFDEMVWTLASEWPRS